MKLNLICLSNFLPSYPLALFIFFGSNVFSVFPYTSFSSDEERCLKADISLFIRIFSECLEDKEKEKQKWPRRVLLKVSGGKRIWILGWRRQRFFFFACSLWIFNSANFTINMHIISSFGYNFTHMLNFIFEMELLNLICILQDLLNSFVLFSCRRVMHEFTHNYSSASRVFALLIRTIPFHALFTH